MKITFWDRIHDSWYYLKCLLFHRYNVIKVRSLPPTWVDRDELMFPNLPGFCGEGKAVGDNCDDRGTD